MADDQFIWTVFSNLQLSQRMHQPGVQLDQPMELFDTFSSLYKFTFATKNIIHRVPLEPPARSTLSLKLGTKMVRCQHFDQEVTLELEIKQTGGSGHFNFPKGIIKIYDIKEDGSEVINCVGAFQTKEILMARGKEVILNKLIGSATVILAAKAEVVGLDDEDSNFSEQSLEFGDEPIRKTAGTPCTQPLDDLKSAINLGRSMPIGLQLHNSNKNSIVKIIQDDDMVSVSDISSLKSIKKLQDFNLKVSDMKENSIQLKRNQTSLETIKYNILPLHNSTKNLQLKKEETNFTQVDFKDSLKKSMNPNLSLSMSCPELLAEFQKRQMEIIGEELILERKKLQERDDKIQKQVLKINLLRARNQYLEQKWGKLVEICRSFENYLQRDQKGQCIIQVNQRKSKISMQYSISPESESTFHDLITLLVKTAEIHQNVKYSNGQGLKNSVDVQKIIDRMEQNEETNNQLKQENQKLKSDFQEMKIKMVELKMNALENNIPNPDVNRLNRELKEMQVALRDTKEKANTIQQVNFYLKQKDQQMEQIISSKEATIENLRKMLASNNTELDQMEDELMNHKKVMKNMELVVDELKQELQTRDDQLEEYERKYGKYKQTRSRDLENHLSDCLRWIKSEESQEAQLKQSLMDSSPMRKTGRNLINFIKNPQLLLGYTMDQLIKMRIELAELNQRVSQAIFSMEERQQMEASLGK